MILNNKPQGGDMHSTQSRFLNLTVRTRTVLLAFIASLPLALTMPAAYAGQYVLEKGKGVEVCEAYGKTLNSLKPTNMRKPFVGIRPINPEFKDFSKPNREDRVLPEDSFIDELNGFLWRRDINPVYFIPVTDWPKWRGTPEQENQAWETFVNDRHRWHFLDYAKVDIDNDGKVEQIALNNRAGVGGILIVLNAQNNGVDEEKTELVMQHPSRKEQGLGEFRKLFPAERLTPIREKYGYTAVEDLLHGGSYDVFMYKGRTYFDLWWHRHPDYKGKHDVEVGGPLRVFTIEDKRTREICTYYWR